MTGFALEESAAGDKSAGMNALLRTSLLALVLGSLLAGCEAPANLPRAALQRNSPEAARWMERRTAQLEQMGLQPGEAAMKARSEWEHLGNPAESYALHDSRAAQQAKQERFESDLAKAGRN